MQSLHDLSHLEITTVLVNYRAMNVQTEQKTDKFHKHHVYVGLAQAQPNDMTASGNF